MQYVGIGHLGAAYHQSYCYQLLNVAAVSELAELAVQPALWTESREGFYETGHAGASWLACLLPYRYLFNNTEMSLT